MSNRKFEMYEYRQIITQMRQGASDRTINKHGLCSRTKAKQIRGRIKDAIATKPLKQPSLYSALKTHWVSSSLKPFLDDC
jgi:hypothetical protein